MTQKDEPTDGSETLIDRRGVLSLAGSAAAATILGVGTASADPSHTESMLLDTTVADEPCAYTIEASEGLTVVPTSENDVTAASDTHVEGTVDGGRVAIRYAGSITTAEVGGPATFRFGDAAEERFEDLGRELVVTSPSSIDYTFTVTGGVERVIDDSDTSAEENNDHISQNDDGSITVTGHTGNGYGDSFRVYGDVVDFSPLEGEYTLSVDGEEVTAYDLTGQEPPETRRVVITTPTEIDYSFTATGGVERVLDDSRMAAEENNDRISENDDGTVTVTGHTGNGYGDSFDVAGEITSFSPMTGDHTVTVDDEEVTTYELVGEEPPEQKRFVVTTPSSIDYTFTATGDVERVLDGSRMAAEENNDHISPNDDGTVSVTGHTGNGYGDSFDVAGEITSFSPMRGDFTLEFDGEEVTTYELVGEEPPSNDGPVIGGGEGYSNAVPESAADVVVETKSELDQALLNAAAGDVVYVSGDADIDMGSSEFTIPRGVTLASDRGIGGSDGGRLWTDESPWPMLLARSDVRVTGLRIEGPRTDWYTRGDLEEGLVADGSNVEVDNVEAYGWGWAAVRCHETAHVHHCDIHTNTESQSGYGVATTTAEQVLIEYNHFHDNRHSVESTGGSFTVRYNHVTGDAISHVFDQHPPGGDRIEIYNNTVEVVDNDWKDKNVPALAVREVPSDGAYVHDNWFHNPKEPRDRPDGWTDEAIIQVHTDSWQNVEFSGNHYGASEPDSDVGCPR